MPCIIARKEWENTLSPSNIAGELRRFKQGLVGEWGWKKWWDDEGKRFRFHPIWISGFRPLTESERDKMESRKKEGTETKRSKKGAPKSNPPNEEISILAPTCINNCGPYY